MSIKAAFMVPHPPLIVNEIGGSEIDKIKTTLESYERVAKEIGELKPDTIIISSPHTAFFRDCFYMSSISSMKGSFSSFGANNVSFSEEIDLELVREIEKMSQVESFPIAKLQKDIELDHGVMVPLYLKNCKIIVVGLSGLSLEKHYHLGEIIHKAVEKLGRKVVFVASGDLSHVLQEYGPYGFSKEGPIYEKKILRTMTDAHFDELLHYDLELLDLAKECGHPSFTIMAGIWSKKQIIPTFFSHEDITGVGYGIWSYYPKKDMYVALAKQTIEVYVKEKRKIDVPNNLPIEMLSKKSGVFVSIHKHGNLRGCIGTFLPMQDCVAKEIIENAISASTRDPRFSAIKEDELKDLEIHVDVLTTPEKIVSKDELDPKKYGVIVSNGFRRGLLLPDLEGVDTVDEQIQIAKQKADIDFSEEISLERFEVVRHKDD